MESNTDRLPKPIPIPIQFDTMPDVLKKLNQWILWRYEYKPEQTKPWTKVPYQINGSKAATNSPSTWSTFEVVKQTYLNRPEFYDGVGFVFTKKNKLCGIDFDHCEDSTALQQELKVLNTYTETSTSGTGCHSVCFGELPEWIKHKRPALGGIVEAYDHLRYFVMTGVVVGDNSAIEERQIELTAFCQRHLRGSVTTKQCETIDEAPTTSAQDTTILYLIRKSKQVDKFNALYAGNTSNYPSPSEADAALVSILSFYTQDDLQIERIWKTSGLKRDKLERADYVRDTIANCKSTEHLWSKASSSKDFHLTDIGNAERLASIYGKDIRYSRGDGDNGEWYVYDNSRWARDCGGRINQFAKQSALSWYDDISKESDDTKRDKLAKHARASESDRALNAAIHIARSEPNIAIQYNRLDSDSWLFNVKNGTIDLHTGELRQARREDYITKIAPVVYDASAQCPRFLQFLNEIFDENTELMRYMQQIMGICLTGDISAEIIPILWGKGSNGKSKFVEAIMGVMGNNDFGYSKITPKDTLTGRADDKNIRNALAQMCGKRLIFCDELEQNMRLRTSDIRQMTNKRNTGERKFHDSFDYDVTYKIIMATNHKPLVKDDSDGMWRRLRLIPFTQQFYPPDRDDKLPEKLAKEYSGILNWMIAGCLDWQQNGLIEPKIVTNATDNYREEEDTIARFIADCFVDNATSWMLNKDILDIYRQWSVKENERPQSRNSLYSKLESIGYIRKHQNTGDGFLGLAKITDCLTDKPDCE